MITEDKLFECCSEFFANDATLQMTAKTFWNLINPLTTCDTSEVDNKRLFSVETIMNYVGGLAFNAVMYAVTVPKRYE